MAERYTVSPRTLTFLRNGDKVLLIKRSRRACLFPGLYNGVGGHVERGEDVLSSARREVREETGLEVTDLSLRCVLHVDEGGEQAGALVFIFVGTADWRRVGECAEGHLHWVPVDRLDQLPLVADLPHLLPRVLSLPAGARPLFARSTIRADGSQSAAPVFGGQPWPGMEEEDLQNGRVRG